MKKMLAVAFLATVAMVGLTQDSEANGGGLFRRSRGCGDCAKPCASAAPAAAPAPVKYEERKIKVAKIVKVEEEIDVLECKRVTKDEKRKVIECTTVKEEVEYKYTVMVPKTVEKKVQCTTYKCVKETVTEKVPVCKLVLTKCVDECGRCHIRLEKVTTIETVSRCVVKRVPVVTEKTVNVTECTPEIRTCKKTVCKVVRTEKEITVKVCSFVTEKVKRKVTVCKTIWEEQTVRVAVGSTSCGSSDGGHGRRLSGLFRRGDCCN
ncbi:MAG: hypothetical protein EXS16_21170 [Gemmataceae bacterium]|nr:hypothetical protein [Gemmataceae bacterium]